MPWRRAELDPGDPVAQVGRQLERCGRLRRVPRDRDRDPRHGLAVGAERGDVAGALDRRRHGGHLGGQGGGGGLAERECHWPGRVAARSGRRSGPELAQCLGRAARRRPGPARPAAMPSLSQTELACSRPGAGPAPRGRPRDRPATGRGCQPGRDSSASRAAMRAQLDAVVGCGRGLEQQDLAALALGLLQQLARDLDPLVPVPRRGPAIVDDQEQRPAAAEAGRRVQERPGQGEDQQCRDHQAQQQEPPGRAGRRALAG